MLDSLRRLVSDGMSDDVADLPDLVLRPIGVVRNSVKRPWPNSWEAIVSRIILRPELAEDAIGLGGFSHLLVLFWLHLVPARDESTRRLLPLAGDAGISGQGVLATRSQQRPNPIGTTVAYQLSSKGNILRVRGLDAIDGTPVLDVKPYIPHYDSVANARLPRWAVMDGE